MKTIKIAGAGISGLTASINLAKYGYQVEIFEKKNKIAHRFKGDFQGLENWSTPEDIIDLLKSFNLDINFKTTPSYNFQVCGYKRELKNFDSQRPFYYLIQRGFEDGYLDKGLYEQAIKLGVKIHFDTKELPNDIDIFATGPSQASAAIVGVNFKTDHKNTHLMFCDNELAPKGYAYLLIVDGHGTIATAFMPNGTNANSFLKKTVDSVKNIYNINMYDEKKFGSYGSFLSPNKYLKEGKPVIGEAAGLQDFLFGFGLRYAMYSGYLVAKSIHENSNYEHQADTLFSPTIKASLVNRYLYEKLNNKNYEFMINKMTYISDLVSFLGKRYNFGFKRKLLYPIAKKKYSSTFLK